MNVEIEKRASEDRPWLLPEAIELLEKLIKENKIRTVLEFGSGGSTVFFAERVGRVVSIEHNRKWHGRVVKRLRQRNLENAAVLLAPASRKSDREIYRGKDGRYYRKYVEAGVAAARHEFNGFVDCIFVDGRARVACARQCLEHVSPRGILILDDAARDRYRSVEERLGANAWKRIRIHRGKSCSDFWFRPEASATNDG